MPKSVSGFVTAAVEAYRRDDGRFSLAEAKELVTRLSARGVSHVDCFDASAALADARKRLRLTVPDDDPSLLAQMVNERRLPSARKVPRYAALAVIWSRLRSRVEQLRLSEGSAAMKAKAELEAVKKQMHFALSAAVDFSALEWLASALMQRTQDFSLDDAAPLRRLSPEARETAPAPLQRAGRK